MLLPVGHEKGTVTRLPIVTGILILVNILAFLFTNSAINGEGAKNEIITVKTHILILKARYPDLTLTPDVQQMVDQFRKEKPQAWTFITSDRRNPEDAWEAALLLDPDPHMDRLQTEATDLCNRFTTLLKSDSSILWKYAYHSYEPSPASYITHQYLHGGWLHLISNMWMLWLCGVVLEDVWGPFVVLGFYTLAGVFAAFFHGWLTPGSVVPMVGASGAIAGLMGAMLVRFPKLNVKIAYFWLMRMRMGTFLSPVWVLAPLWFIVELFWGLMGDSGVAHWAHVGGFIFGSVVGLGFYAVKLEKVVNKDDPAKTWSPDIEYMEALDAMEQRRDANGCAALLRPYLQKNPNSLEGWQLLLRAQDWKGDHEAERAETLPNLIRISLATGNQAQASQYIEQYRAVGGTQLPPATWIELCRRYEKEQNWEAAAREYEQLGMAYYTSDRVSITALMSAGRLYVTKLNRLADGQRAYTAAKNSPMPHLDMEELIEQGLKQCGAGSASMARSTAGA